MTVLRDGSEIKLEGKVGIPMVKVRSLTYVEDVSENQSSLRQAWLKG